MVTNVNCHWEGEILYHGMFNFFDINIYHDFMDFSENQL